MVDDICMKSIEACYVSRGRLVADHQQLKINVVKGAECLRKIVTGLIQTQVQKLVKHMPRRCADTREQLAVPHRVRRLKIKIQADKFTFFMDLNLQ